MKQRRRSRQGIDARTARRSRVPRLAKLPIALLVSSAAIAITSGVASFPLDVSAHPLPGAIFTTLPDGSVVNGNIYSAKCDVALNGGPANPNSHHVPDGIYDVAVTDPSGKTVLGTGVGVVVISGGAGTFGPLSLCSLVLPSPYETTPNHGGEYKAWLCLAGQLFTNHDCKTDNFKVREETTPPASPSPTPTPTPIAGATGAPTPTPTSQPEETPTPTALGVSQTPVPPPATEQPTPMPQPTIALHQPTPAPSDQSAPTPAVHGAVQPPHLIRPGTFPPGGGERLGGETPGFLIAVMLISMAALTVSLAAYDMRGRSK